MSMMIALAVLVVVAVIFRKVGAALVWYDEVASVLLAWLTYYGAAYAALSRSHIGFPRLVERGRPHIRRYFILVREVIVVGFFVVAAWAGWRVVGVLQGTSLVSLPWVSSQVAQSVIPIGAMLFIAAELASLPQVWNAVKDTEVGQSG